MYVGIWKYFFLCIKTDIPSILPFVKLLIFCLKLFEKWDTVYLLLDSNEFKALKYGLPRYHYIDKNIADNFPSCVKKNHPICTFSILRFVTFSRHSYSLDILKITTDKTVKKV